MGVRPALHGGIPAAGGDLRRRREDPPARQPHETVRERIENRTSLNLAFPQRRGGRQPRDNETGLPVPVAGPTGAGLALHTAILGHRPGTRPGSRRVPDVSLSAQFQHFGKGNGRSRRISDSDLYRICRIIARRG